MSEPMTPLGPITPVNCPDYGHGCYWAAHGIPDAYTKSRDLHLALHRAEEHGEPLSAEQADYARANGYDRPAIAADAGKDTATGGESTRAEQPLTAERLTEIAALISDVQPATDGLLTTVAESVRDVREHDHATQREDWFCLNLTSYMGGKAGPILRRLLNAEAEADRLRARVAEVEADCAALQQDKECVFGAAERYRARVAELEQAESDTYPPALPWATLMDHEDLTDFLDELAAAAITHADSETALAEVEAACGRWRPIAEAQHAHNTAPGPDAAEAGEGR